MEFRKYEHLERLGHTETRDLQIGRVYVFPKIDGTNASIWLDDNGQLCCGSRNRQVSLEQDNQGFAAWAMSDPVLPVLVAFLLSLPVGSIVYGEWLVPHTLKTYRSDAWRRFWIFDVWTPKGFMPYESYNVVAKDLILVTPSPSPISIVAPLCVINSPSKDQLHAQVATNTYLIEDNAGVGEGIVLKNYEWRNVHGRQTWAKIVRNEFKESNQKAFGIAEKQGETRVEQLICDQFCTATLVGKTRAKVEIDIANKHGLDLTGPNDQQFVEERHRGEMIPQLLSRVFHDLVIEELWEAIKKHRNPTVDFALLNNLVTRKIKSIAQDLFS